MVNRKKSLNNLSQKIETLLKYCLPHTTKALLWSG